MREVSIECSDDSPLCDGPWLLQPMPDSVHVIFEAEAKSHELDCGCWCRPSIEAADPITHRLFTKPLIIHRRVVSGEA